MLATVRRATRGASPSAAAGATSDELPSFQFSVPPGRGCVIGRWPEEEGRGVLPTGRAADGADAPADGRRPG
ncbi:hypothetical protein JCM9957A_31180 [Kineosporia succinea]